MNKERINEASIYSLPDEQTDIARRRLTANRVITILDKAVKEAEKKGDNSTASKLRARIDLIQGALDKASHISDSAEEETADSGDLKDAKKDSNPENQTDSADSTESGRDEDTGSEKEGPSKDESEEGENEDGKKNSDEDDEKDDTEESEKSKKDTSKEDKSEQSKDSKESTNSDENKEDPSDEDKENQNNSDSDSSNSDEDDQEDINSDNSMESDSSETPEEPDTAKPIGPKNPPKKVYLDPFKKTNDPKMQKIMDGLPSETEIESLEDSLKRILSKLSSEGKEGAIEALKDKLSQMQESLKEEYTGKSIAEMSADEFNDLVNSSLDLADKVIKVSYSTDLDSRIKEIQASANDTLKNRELDAEDNAILNKERKDKIMANETESDRYRNSNLKSMQSFSKTIYRAIKDQIDTIEDEEDTWSAIDKRHEDDPSIIVPGKKMDDLPEGEIPSVDLYIDQSGSFDDEDIEHAKAAISNIVEFERRGEIKLKIYYFANHVFTWPEVARAEGGTNAWPLIVENIIANDTKNVIIVSDSDLGYARTSPLKVDGIVCYLWKNGDFAVAPTKRLQGRQGTYQYSFE